MKQIAETYCNSPYIAYYTWISDDTREKKGNNDFMFSLVSDVDTGIHETAHQFCSSAAYIDSEYTTSTRGYLSYSAPSRITSVYLEEWGVHHIIQTPCIPAREISDFIRNKDIMEDSRFTTYISPSSTYQSTQLEGIYGLLDEYHAYYYSLIATTNKALDTTLDSSYEEDGHTYSISSFSDIYLSFLQFSTYIFTYIRVVESKHPWVYTDIMENRLLLEAIIRIHDAFKMKYDRFVQILDSGINTMGSDPFEDEHTLLKAEYELPENQQVLEELRKAVESFEMSESPPAKPVQSTAGTFLLIE